MKETKSIFVFSGSGSFLFPLQVLLSNSGQAQEEILGTFDPPPVAGIHFRLNMFSVQEQWTPKKDCLEFVYLIVTSFWTFLLLIFLGRKCNFGRKAWFAGSRKSLEIEPRLGTVSPGDSPEIFGGFQWRGRGGF